MIGLALILGATQARTSLQYYQGTFFISDGALITAVRRPQAPASDSLVRFRRGDTYTVWDKRGMSLRNGNWIYDTRFKELAVSPKLFSKQEIHKTLELVKTGQRNQEAFALSGALRLGTDAFFLPRWIDKKGFTWLEAMVRVDLTSKHPKPVLVGRLPGQSMASGSVDHQLFPLGAQPAIVVRQGSNWGVAAYDPILDEFTYTNIGERLRAYSQLGGKGIAYIEAVEGGLLRLGLADMVTASRRDVLEDRGSIRLLDTYHPFCAVITGSGPATIRNMTSGAALTMPEGSEVQRTMFGVLMSWPKGAPKHAVLLDPERWDRLAIWQAPVQTEDSEHATRN